MANRREPKMVRIDTEAHAALIHQAAQMGVTIGQLASMLIKAGCQRAEVDG